MARPRKFDEHTAIERAMQAFWSGGYEGTSTEQLCEATGLGRSSIYNTFTSKHELFRKSLRHYAEVTAETRAGLLDTPEPVRDRVRRLLRSIIDDELSHDRRGCLAVNTVMEFGRTDPEIAAVIRRDSARFVDDLRALFEQAQRDGEIDRNRDPVALARFLHSTIGGLRVQARQGLSRAALESIADVALTAL
ncbi:TetR/AcrR family transcriptional regulator [Amycolatopsis taiwanensis]|uniref:TetR family transcriptional regulator n=1 Tax=Amycolatopsis taiwanensis TaxID=342230 RepID=A0A9W6R204_9PSEU|nr:TetR/AcrR family transcriptional regulator [Amycolatopsis taiwanensis]GLY67694.1 TetR family transcriptional regulator [Amycolatopsis taiwanensis]